jgi:hypothetical protein
MSRSWPLLLNSAKDKASSTLHAIPADLVLAGVRSETLVASFVPYGLRAMLTAANAARETDGRAVTRQILDIPRRRLRALGIAGLARVDAEQ